MYSYSRILTSGVIPEIVYFQPYLKNTGIKKHYPT